MHSDDNRNSGFSLLEVLVAFVILSGALVAANQSLSYSLRAFSAAKTVRAADRLAEEIFAERFSSPDAPSEEMGSTSSGLTWRLKREPFFMGEGNGEAIADKLTLEVTTQTDGNIHRRYVSYRSVRSSELNNAQ